jgi:hypothetical protein
MVVVVVVERRRHYFWREEPSRQIFRSIFFAGQAPRLPAKNFFLL